MKKIILWLPALWLAACAPTLNISTPEPVQIDVNMRADIFTHDGREQTAEPAATATTNEPTLTAAQRRYNRRAEIQNLKNNRIIGEGRDALLYIRELPADEKFAAYTRQTVAAENADRREEFKIKAEELNKPLDVFIRDVADTYRRAAYPGEWIQEDDGTWKKR